MDIVGYIFLALIAVAILVGLVFLASSAHDIVRYERIRRM